LIPANGEGLDSRKHERVQLDGGIVARSSQNLHFGPVVNIGMGGLAFDYSGDRKLPNISFHMDVISEKSCLKICEIPVERFSFSLDINKWHKPEERIRRCGVQFGRISVKQKTLLLCLIFQYRTF